MKTALVLVIGFAANGLPPLVRSQGPLTPPGAPAPTMKSLTEVEPRLAVNATSAPGDANYEAVISNPGSYYLTGNLNVAKPNGIHVTVAGVTLDLEGFQISRASGTGGDGITIDAGAHRCVVDNGSIANFANGVNCAGSHGGAFRRLAVSGCSAVGLSSGYGWQFDGCRAHDNTGGYGLLALVGSSLMNCTAEYNVGNGGIFSDNACTLINCTACYNTGTAGYGFTAGDNSTLTNCVAFYNAGVGLYGGFTGSVLRECAAKNNGGDGIECTLGTVTNCTSSNNTGNGITAGDACLISNCNVTGNTGDGIHFTSYNVITGNTAVSNYGAGIRSIGSINRIDGNASSGNVGVGIVWGNDFVVRNSAFLNTGGNYSPTPGTGNTGPIQAASSSTNPWANF
jgi:hypothetical protein